MKGVQCYELFGGIALKNHIFHFRFSTTRFIVKAAFQTNELTSSSETIDLWKATQIFRTQ